MILVVNLNASLDKHYELADLVKGEVVRARSVQNTPGGKGLHVANVATILGEDCLATGFLGGKTGEFIEEKLRDYGIQNDFIKISGGETRSCLAFITDDGAQSEVLEPGPAVKKEELDAFMALYKKRLAQAELVAACGSAPPNVPEDIYARLIGLAREAGKKFFLDTSGALLKNAIAAKPYFIKPNKDELEALTGRKITRQEDAVDEIENFHAAGIDLVAISLGANGSIVGYQGNFYRVAVPKIKAVNPVGSGDAYVAGMAAAVRRGYAIEEAIKYAAACGTANALEKEIGFVTKSVVEELTEKIVVEKIKG